MDTQNTSALSIHDAAKQGDYGIVETWLNKEPASVDSRDDSECTPLHLAAIAGHFSIVKLLLEHGADPCAKDKLQVTPLKSMIREDEITEQHHQIAKFLLQQGITANQLTDSNEKSPLLHTAATTGHTEIVRLFLIHGADPNAVNDKGYTPWHISNYMHFDCYKPEIIAIFLKHPNINPNVIINTGESVILPIIREIKRTSLKKEKYRDATDRYHQKKHENYTYKNAQLIQCLNYFIFAGVTLNEEEIKQECYIKSNSVFSEDFYRKIQRIIEEALTIKETVKSKLSRLPYSIRKYSKHVLLSSEAERNAFLQAIETLYDDHVNERKSLFFSCPTEMINQIVQNRLDDLIGDYDFPDLNHNQAELDSQVRQVI